MISKYTLFKTILFCSAFLTLQTFSQSYSLDQTFNCPYDFAINQSGVFGAIPNSSGLLISGDFEDGNYPYKENLMKIYFDGSIDPSFSHAPLQYSYSLEKVVKTDLNEYIYYIDYAIIYKADCNGAFIDSSWVANLQNDMHNNILTVFLPEKVHYNYFFIGTNGPSSYPYHFRRLLLNGSIDTTFIHNSDAYVNKILDYDTNKILLSGFFRLYDNLNYSLLCRIDTLGNIDSSFHSIFITNPNFYQYANPGYIQPDGKIIISGTFKINSSTDTLGLIRLMPNGDLDTTFNNFNQIHQFNIVGGCNTICPTSDGGYLIGGGFTSYQNQLRNHIAKINANGYLDTISFNGYGIDSVNTPVPLVPEVLSIVNDPTDIHRYYVMGEFASYNGQQVKPIIRLIESNVGINELKSLNSNINIYPNPTHDMIIIKYNLPNANKLDIINPIGEILFEEKIENNSQPTIDTSSFPTGIYLVRITAKSGRVTQRFVKE